MAGKRFNFSKIGQQISSLTNRRSSVNCNLVVIGDESVGKTALIVRFLTKKYLPEYSNGTREIYNRDIIVDGKIVHTKITDTLGTDSYTSLISSCLLCNQDAIVIVYSITDKRSFVKACDLVKLIQSDLGSLHNQSNSISIIQKFKPIIALIGNKNDLTHFRAVSSNDGKRMACCQLEIQFHECSSAKGWENIELIFKGIIRKVINNKELRSPISALSFWSSSNHNNHLHHHHNHHHHNHNHHNHHNHHYNQSNHPSRRYSAGAWWRRHRTHSNGGQSEEELCEGENCEEEFQRHDRTFTM